MDVEDEYDQIERLRTLAGATQERADAVSRYTEVPGVREWALSARAALAGVADVCDAMEKAVDTYEEEE